MLFLSVIRAHLHHKNPVIASMKDNLQKNIAYSNFVFISVVLQIFFVLKPMRRISLTYEEASQSPKIITIARPHVATKSILKCYQFVGGK